MEYSVKFDYQDISQACVKCAKCIPTCTIHIANGDEATSPRGFLDLIGAYDRGELELDKNTKKIFESCFLCTNCVEVCPNDLPVDRMIENVRNDLREKFGLAWYKKLFFFLLRHRKIMDFMSKLGYVFQTCGFKIKEAGMKPRFSFPLIKKNRLLPSAMKKSFLNSHPEIIENGGKQKVGIFIGCMANYSYTSIGESLLDIFKELQIDAHLMKAQLCCSAPAYFTGDFKTTEYLAKYNIEYLEKQTKDLDAVIIPEATCSAMIKVDYPHFFEQNPEWKARAENINKKIFMATEWLHANTEIKSILEQKGKSSDIVTYHDPCHARKMQGIYQEPRDLISQNYVMKNMSNSNACCGFGGVTTQVENHEYAKVVGKIKADMIEETNADVVSAECSACRMQINDSMDRAELKTKFRNPIELIAKALKS
ncbi:MAG: Putative oxidoreductase ferredoxin-type protein, clusters with CPO [uncultured Campylobacterales bacterium]|uniref:Glycolate oxidase iron-sulfur subunit n=1 Tax=uncultured Campylobacterales bacterium TaxID=352960 RepID=A0A6S6S6Z9_9BACT|nr:MAG: Putative oxidoreductase ferredoxin-type protein, clusters with CPO [uncultured Campylobacterales bacterium]